MQFQKGCQRRGDNSLGLYLVHIVFLWMFLFVNFSKFLLERNRQYIPITGHLLYHPQIQVENLPVPNPKVLMNYSLCKQFCELILYETEWVRVVLTAFPFIPDCILRGHDPTIQSLSCWNHPQQQHRKLNNGSLFGLSCQICRERISWPWPTPPPLSCGYSVISDIGVIRTKSLGQQCRTFIGPVPFNDPPRFTSKGLQGDWLTGSASVLLPTG